MDGIILGDSGYPQRSWLFTPIAAPRSVPETRYNVAHRRTRSYVEHAFGLLKTRWRVLHSECRFQPEKLCKVATVCAMLHNIAIDAAGVPAEIEEEEGDQGNDENANPGTGTVNTQDFMNLKRAYALRHFGN